MEYLYYKSENGNFGDDLNGWLWPRIFGEEDSTDNLVFFGIGTILYEKNKHIISSASKNKLVFGTGVRPVHRRFVIDKTWDVRFLRGPLSARYFNNKFKYISDAAYALKISPEFEKIRETPKRYGVSFIPYFKSESYFDWRKICKELGIHYITTHSTNEGIEFTLQEIAASKYIISEAMHGAILADIFRVPWRRFIISTPYTEGEHISEFKWTDWMNSIGVLQHEPLYVPLFQKGRFNSLVRDLTRGRVDAQIFLKGKVYDQIVGILNKPEISYELSSDQKVTEIFSAIEEEFKNLNHDLGRFIY